MMTVVVVVVVVVVAVVVVVVVVVVVGRGIKRSSYLVPSAFQLTL